MFTVCFSHREARQRPTSSVFLVFYMHIYMNMNILCECVRMLLLFFFKISSEKYARYYFDLSSSLYFALIGFFSFTLFSILNFLLLMLNTLLHYY